MTRTLIDVDDENLARAAAVLGTKTKVETVNRALADIAQREQRLEALAKLDELANDLGEPEVMRGAWR